MRLLKQLTRLPVRRGRPDHDRAAAGPADPPRIKAVARPLYVEAQPRDRSLGTVKGFAVAFACRKHGRSTETYVLVDDPSKPSVIWVKESEIRLRFMSGRPRSGGHGQ
jgi:hypothetical protein